MNALVVRVSSWMAAAACISLLALMMITFVDVMGRYFFNKPLVFAVELVELGMGLLMFFGLAITTLNRGHISVDLISEAVPKPVQRVLFVLSATTSVVFIGLMAWRLWDRAVKFMSDGLATQILFLPVHPVVFVMAISAGVSTLIALFLVFKPADSAREG
jgi:TRAP-type C4-dicarboxylate transport system permease small subunit